MMVYYHPSPLWFLLYDTLFEFFFSAMSFVLAFFSFKIYRKTEKGQAKYFAWAFLLLALSFLVEGVTNFLVMSRLNEGISTAVNPYFVAMSGLNWRLSTIGSIGIYIRLILMICGLSVLLNVWEGKNSAIFTAIPSVIAILSSSQPVYVCYLLASIYLAFIAAKFAGNYLASRKGNPFIIMTAFVLLFLGYIQFFLSVGNQTFYLVAHVFEFAAFLLISINFYMVLKGK